ncbi:MAG: DUF131 domain-containing protein [Nitrososphaerales archaeon]
MQRLLGLGLALVVVGFVLVAIGCAGGGAISVGGVVFIGPIPFVFGSGPAGDRLALVSVVVGATMMMVLLTWAWRLFSSRRA